MPALAAEFDVLAVDLPGFGESPPLPAGQEPTPAALAAAVAGLLDELGIDRPHVAGNSLGGWVALELAALRPLASVALLSPAGLWPDGTPALRPAEPARHPRAHPHAGAAAERADAVPRGAGGRAGAGLRPAGPDDPGAGPGGDQRVRPLPRLPAHPARHGRPALPVHGADRRAGHRRVRLAATGCCCPARPGTSSSCPPAPRWSRCPAAATSRWATTRRPWPRCSRRPPAGRRPLWSESGRQGEVGVVVGGDQPRVHEGQCPGARLAGRDLAAGPPAQRDPVPLGQRADAGPGSPRPGCTAR